jgi:hypothetical protein
VSGHLRFRWLTLFIILIFNSNTQAQTKYAYNPWVIDTLYIASDSLNKIQLPPNHRLLAGSLRINFKKQLLSPEAEYRFDNSHNNIQFFQHLGQGDTLHLHYQIQPVLLKKTYSLFAIDSISTSEVKDDTFEVVTRSFQNPFRDFGGNLKRSGSIVRGINIGSNKDLTLNSGLNLQLSGQLSDDIEIVAALTDEATPIQPEGNTQSLREVDKVFIEFKSPWLSGVLGDFNLKFEESAFAAISRKLQGISLNGSYSGLSLGGTVASTRGFFNFISFLGQEGNQGPYQLLGKNGEREIIVLAGTERVWINGERMVRGENNDYIIEYGNGQITFSNKRLISSESRIEVDFEYYPAIQKYTRTVYGARSESVIISDQLEVRAKYYHEEDDPQHVLEEEGLSAEEESILGLAGDDPLAAFVDGAVNVDSGAGSYIFISDTVINNQTVSFYKYIGPNRGNYRISFSFVGQGMGDYVRDRLSVYRWVGKNKGNYLPVRLLALPVRQQLADVQINYNPTERLKIRSEIASSWLDKNLLSTLNDHDNRGIAAQINTVLEPTNIFLGKLSLNLNGRYIDDRFSRVDRINRPDFNRYWNISTTQVSTEEEKSIEAGSTLNPWQWMQFQGNLGLLNRQDLKSFRYALGAKWDSPNWFRGNLRQEYIKSTQSFIRNEWIRQQGRIEKDIWYLQPAIEIEHEQRKGVDAAQTKGFNYLELRARLGLIGLEHLRGFLMIGRRDDDVFNPDKRGQLIPQANTLTRQFRLELSEWKRWSGHFELLIRNKNYSKFFETTRIDSVKLLYADAAFQDTVWQDRETNLAELVLNNYQWDKALDIRWQYRISTEQLALREKVYLDVGDGRGNLRFDDLLEEYVPDPDGNFILFIVPSGKFEPITNFQTSLRLRLDPARHFRKPVTSFQKLLSKFSSETFVRIDEETREKNLRDIYLINLSRFQKEKTLRGSMIFNQDVDILRRSRNISFRLRYRYRDDRSNQFLDENDNEDRLTIERGLRASYRLFKDVKGQSEFRQKFTVRENRTSPTRERDIRAALFNQNISYRPTQTWEIGLESENGWERDNANFKNLYLRYNRILFRATYALLKKGRITADFDYQNVTVLENPLNAVIPFEMARGKRKGTSKRWQLRGDYTIAENIVVSLFYSGRDDADFREIIHSGQAEIRAYF